MSSFSQANAFPFSRPQKAYDRVVVPKMLVRVDSLVAHFD